MRISCILFQFFLKLVNSRISPATLKIRLLNVNDENLVNKGDVVCMREDKMPVSDLFEAEIEVLELLSYKPILSKGYQCILHIHTVADEASIKDIMVSYEKNEKGEIVEK